MASIFKRHYRDANGNPSECERFTVEFRDGAGCFRQVRGYADHAASAELGRKLEKLAERRRTRDKLGGELLEWVEGLPPKLRDKLARWGILDPVGVASGKPLANHLADYRQALLDGAASSKQKGPATQKHADLVAYHVQTLLNGIGATALADVTVEAVGRYLAGRRAKKDLSVQSSNNYVKDAKAFLTGWFGPAGRQAIPSQKSLNCKSQRKPASTSAARWNTTKRRTYSMPRETGRSDTECPLRNDTGCTGLRSKPPCAAPNCGR